MYDLVFPKNNEAEYIKQANKLGYSELVFVYSEKAFNSAPKANPIAEKHVIKIVKGSFCEKKFVTSEYSVSNNSKFIKQGIKLLYGVETTESYMHQRASGLNESLAKSVKEKGIFYGINFSELIESKRRAELLGSIMQNIMLCKKLDIPIVIASFAASPDLMRNPQDLIAFGRILQVQKTVNL